MSSLPILSNKIGAEGIAITNEKEYLLCENPKDYIEAIEKLKNPEFYHIISENAKLCMNDKYDLGLCAQELNEIFNSFAK